jgi:5-methylcytosine-specific restriction enzyme subunit McrC
VLQGVSLSADDRKSLAELGGLREGRHLEIEELKAGLRIRSTSWVGVVRFQNLEIRVIPKLAGDNLGLVRMLEYASGLANLWRPKATSGLDLRGRHLLDVVALLFAGAVEELTRKGLVAGYREREEPLPRVRGRILADQQLLRRVGQSDRVICRFDELEQDVDENRFVLAALRVALRQVSTPEVRSRLGRLRAVFESICDPKELDLGLARRLVYDRLNSHYKTAHALAWLILDGFGVDDLFTGGSTRAFAFLFDMNLLFERFVRRLVADLLPPPDHRVDYQRVHSSILWDVIGKRPYARVIPDLVVSLGHSRAQLPIDAKYKLYDEKPLSTGDIYRSFLYAYSIGRGQALLVYPQSPRRSDPIHLRVQGGVTAGAGAEIRAVGVAIPRLLDELLGPAPRPSCEALRELIVENLVNTSSAAAAASA